MAVAPIFVESVQCCCFFVLGSGFYVVKAILFPLNAMILYLEENGLYLGKLGEFLEVIHFYPLVKKYSGLNFNWKTEKSPNA